MNLPEFKKFSEVIEYIDANYDFKPRGFKNGAILNKTEENQGSQKVFSLASIRGLSKEETLRLFCEHYEAVLADPSGTGHPNIREFMKRGWANLAFTGEHPALSAKPEPPSAKINENIANMPANYLFKEIADRVAKYQAEHPDAKIIRLGIGDVTRPIPKACVDAMVEASLSLLEKNPGYGDAEGYKFLREAIAERYAAEYGVSLDASEIFVNEGAKADSANIIDIFGHDNKIAVPDPVYPVYLDTHAMAGHLGKYDPKTKKWSKAIYLPMTMENGFVPELPKERPDIIYLCFPNNPTGAVLTRDQLANWVDYANENRSVILFDGAYETFITDPSVPHSIYEIPGADKCAIEFRSFSKDAGFTGLRCGYTVIPHALKAGDAELNKLWARRLSSKFNATSYVTQKGAAAALTPEGQKQIAQDVSYYRQNAAMIKDCLENDMGLKVQGGDNAPYLWAHVGMPSWEFFDYMLEEKQIAGTPGEGFGPSGNSYFRLTAFGSHENTAEAIARLKNGHTR
jgi:LL-diaminopimelate aminotransferase